LLNLTKLFINGSFEIGQKANKVRQEELESFDRYCHPHDAAQKAFLKQEKAAIVQLNSIQTYFTDAW
jgi:hypothetical protein